MQVPIETIKIREGRRGLDNDHVKELAKSISELGLLNPVTIDKENFLIAGMHRLEAAKALGWTEVGCTVSSLEGLQAELAEIDENFVRNDLTAVEYGEMLLRRKEIYEALHPETKNGGDRKSEEIRTSKCRSDSVKSFVQDTAEKLGVGKRTVERQIQTAKNLTPEAKEIIRESDAKISKKTALKLSQLEPEQQKEAAALLAAKEISTVDEYKAAISETENTETEPYCEPDYTEEDTEDVYSETEPEQEETGDQQEPETMPAPQKEGGLSIKEIVAQLKNTDKDYSGTPESFLEEYAAFVRKFEREIGWYSNPYYDDVYPRMNKKQLAELREFTDFICSEAEGLYNKVAESRKK